METYTYDTDRDRVARACPGVRTTTRKQEPAVKGEPATTQTDRPMKPQQQVQEGSRGRLLAGTPTRHDDDGGAARARTTVVTKGCATFLVGEQGEAPRRVAVPVARLGHPRMLELLGEARDEYGFAHQGAIVVPCAVERFMRAVEEASAPAGNRHGHGHAHHHHHFRLPHIHIRIARCFRPSRSRVLV